MNYTKTIREYCLQNKGEIFDVSYMKDRYFEMVPYKTLLKILNRLEAEGILSGISKGVYKINDDDDSDTEDLIVNRYVSNEQGMYAGYTMYNELGVSKHKSDIIEIYTKRLEKDHKTIGKYHLKKMNLSFTEDVVAIISLLDCIENTPTIIDPSYIRLYQVKEELAEKYNDISFMVIVSVVKYQYSTIISLKELLDKKRITNNCISIYERCSKK